MRLFFTVLLGWCVLSIAIGRSGSEFVFNHWDVQQRLELLRIASQTLLLLDSDTAPSGARSSRQQLEQYLQQQIRDQEVVVRILPLRDKRKTELAWAEVQREPAAAGHYLYRIDLPLPSSAEIDGVFRMLRRSSPAERLRAWWLGWLAINALILATAVVARIWVRRQRRRQTDSLLQWVDRLNALSEFAEEPGESPRHAIDFPTDAALGPWHDVLQHIAELISDQLNKLLLERGRSRLVLSNLREGVVALDPSLRVLLMNSAAANMLGEKLEEVQNRPLVELTRTPELVEMVRRVVNTNATVEQELGFSHSSRLIRVIARPLPLSHDRLGVLVTLRDITQERRLESVRRDFVANASHELKSPLAAIRAYAETLQLGAMQHAQDRERFLAQIIEQTERLDALVRGMLQLARVEAGYALQWQEIDVAEQIRPCAKAARSLCETQAVRWSDNLDRVHITSVSCAEALRTIVNNLLSNAIRYTSAGGEIELTVDDQGGSIRVRVRDTGQGIAQDDLERIFERFYRAADDRATHTSGTGLGLSIVKHLVQELQGQVFVSSQLGAGSTFTVVLPKQPDNLS